MWCCLYHLKMIFVLRCFRETQPRTVGMPFSCWSLMTLLLRISAVFESHVKKRAWCAMTVYFRQKCRALRFSSADKKIRLNVRQYRKRCWQDWLLIISTSIHYCTTFTGALTPLNVSPARARTWICDIQYGHTHIHRIQGIKIKVKCREQSISHGLAGMARTACSLCKRQDMALLQLLWMCFWTTGELHKHSTSLPTR